jgi:hypothetical protein
MHELQKDIRSLPPAQAEELMKRLEDYAADDWVFRARDAQLPPPDLFSVAVVAASLIACRQQSALRDPPLGFALKMYNAKPGRMGDGVGTPYRVQLVDQYTDMEFDCVDRYAKAASNRLVGHPLGKEGQHLQLAGR